METPPEVRTRSWSSDGRRDRARQFLRIVAQNAEIGDLGAEALDQAGQQIAVGIVKRRARQCRSRLDDLVAGREQGDAHAPADFNRGETERGRERHVLRRKPPAGRQRHRAGRDVFAGEAAVGAAFEPRRHDHGAAVDAAILLHEHRIGARRHRRAGEDADRFAVMQRAARGMPGGDPIHDRKPGLLLAAEIVGAHRVAIDRRVVEWRQIDAAQQHRRRARGRPPAAAAPSRCR